jgi:hypothetical protein
LGNFGSTLTDLQVSLGTAPGAGATWTFTIDKNGAPTGLSCFVTSAGTSCSDLSLVTVNPGDKISLDVTPTGSPALTTVSWSAKIAP